MASNPTATLSSLLTASSIDDHEEVLKWANTDLKKDKTNHEALHTRVVALLKLDRFEDALRALDEGGERLAERCILEKAYALYKTGHLDAATTVLENAPPGSRGLRHVAAQVAYRAEKFEDAARIYKDLKAQDAAIEGEANDLRINSSAADVQLEWQGNGDLVEQSRKRPGREELEAFETAYNAACGYIARGDLAAGTVLLKRARDLCEALDELSDEEKRAEILPIMVQQSYVLTRMGKLEEAEALNKMINIADVPEPPTRVVAQNNFLASSAQHDNPYLALRLFDSVPALSKTEKLFKRQARIIERNRYALQLQSLKYSGVARSTAKSLMQDTAPTTSAFINNISVLNAAAFARCESARTGLKQILPLLDNRPTDLGLILTIIQIYVQTNNSGSATGLLEHFFKSLEESVTRANQDIRFAPGLIALIVSLYQSLGRKAALKAELAKAASYWRRKSKPSDELLRAAGVSLLDSAKLQDHSVASEIFVGLRNNDPKDRVAIAGFVASTAVMNNSAVRPDLEKLTPVERLISGTDAQALEEAGIATLPIVASEVGKKRPATSEKVKVANKKIRRSRMPKEFEEGKKMDPERWLPMKDRSTYRPKGKKGKKRALDATQGGIVKDEESLELVGGAGAVKVEKAPVGSGKAKKKKVKK